MSGREEKALVLRNTVLLCGAIRFGGAICFWLSGNLDVKILDFQVVEEVEDGIISMEVIVDYNPFG